MIEKNLVIVDSSITFRDIVMDMDHKGQKIYARMHATTGPTYEILPRHADAFQKITLNDLFGSCWAPIYMEDFAQALPDKPGSGTKIDIFTL